MRKWGRRAEDQQWFIRLNRTEVRQHNIIWVCFAALVITGMMSLIPTTWIIAVFGKYSGSVYLWRRYLHFIFAFGLFVGCVWHLYYMLLTNEGREVLMAIILKPNDLIQMKENILYMLGMRPHKPKFDRFDYKEKLEYLFGCIGTVVIFITGSIMTFAYLFPKFVVELAATFHLMEATLASFAISIWHFYAVHLKPGKFPQDTSWIDGKMTLHHLEEEHPLYYEKIMKERGGIREEEEKGIGEGAGVVEGARPAKAEPKKLGVEDSNKLWKKKYGRGPTAKVVSAVSYLILFVLLIMLFKVTYLHKKEVMLGPPPVEIAEATVEEKVKIKPVKKEDLFRIIQMEKAIKTMEHFHNLDETVDVREWIPNLCLICHGSLPHSKIKETRALYNMHTYFCACEVCHLKGEEIIYTWFDTKTGEQIDKISNRVEQQVPKGTYSGNYGAKIIPCIAEGVKLVRLDQPVTEQEAKRYLDIWVNYTYDQQSQAKLELHRQLTKEPVKCSDCHQKQNPYLDFERLGYPKHMVDEFVGTEVAGMIEKYKSLKLPTMFRPDEIIQQKQSAVQGTLLPPTFQPR